MNITVTRYRKKSETIDGRLTIDGTSICDTAENALHAIPAGQYRVSIIKCKQHARKMPVILLHKDLVPGCAHCPDLEFVGNNTSMPCKCPQLCPGNGVYNRKDGAIILGDYIAPVCLKHPKVAFDNLYDRIRKSYERGHDLLLEIVEAYPPERKVPHTLYEQCQDWLERVNNEPKLLNAPSV